MKRFIRWLARVFGAEITVERVSVVEKTVYLPPNGGKVDGDIYVEGNLSVTGYIKAVGGISCKESK